MDYKTLTEEQLSALHIADVSESFLTFKNEYGGTFQIQKKSKGFAFDFLEVHRGEQFTLNVEQTNYMIAWLNSR
jgi:hypothetical protein